MDVRLGYIPPPIDWRDVPERDCLVIARRLNLNDLSLFFPEALGKLYTYALPQGVASQCFGRYLTWTGDVCEIEVGVIVDRPLSSHGDIASSSLGGHRALFARNIGPFRLVERAYEAIELYADRHGIELSGAPYEIYLDDPAVVPGRELRTDVYWPVRLD